MYIRVCVCPCVRVTVASPVPSANLGPGESPCNLTVTTSDAVGYLSNRHPVLSPGTRRCGTDSDPWILNVLPGQRINVTLLDFTAPAADTSVSLSQSTGGYASALPRSADSAFYLIRSECTIYSCDVRWE